MLRSLSLIPALVLLGSCKSPPKPPTVDEATKRPVNAAALVQLQACRSDLQNTRILMNDSVRSAEAARTDARLSEQRRAAAEQVALAAEQRNTVYAILFAFGSARIEVGDAATARLIAEARTAPLILLRGRTDGSAATVAEMRVARERAEAAEAWLVAAGVERAHIRTTWQPAGDHAADNSLVDGRTLNRRVEIEIYRSAPEVMALNQPPSATARHRAQRVTSTLDGDDHGQ